MNWKPKNDTVGTPPREDGKGGWKPASEFDQIDLNNMIERAKARKVDVNTFLLANGLVPNDKQLTLDHQVERFSPDEAPKKTRNKK